MLPPYVSRIGEYGKVIAENEREVTLAVTKTRIIKVPNDRFVEPAEPCEMALTMWLLGYINQEQLVSLRDACQCISCRED